MEEWKEYKLGEVTIMKNGKKRPKENGPFPVYGGNGIMDYANNYNAEKVIIVGRVGAYCGNVFKCDDKCWVSDNAISVFAKDIINKDYLYYLMCTLDLHHHHIGAAQPLMTQDIIGNFDVRLPSLPTQQKIANILSSLDDKIEVNRRINEQLEELAQALFKSWFVDFEPFKDGEFVESELGMIPKGWKVCELSDILYISKDSINPSKTPDNLFHHYSIPAYDNSKREEAQEGKAIMSNKFKVTNKTTLFSKLNPRIKRVWFIDNVKENAICSTEFVPYKAKNNELTYYVNGLINSDLFYNQALSIVNGATGSHQRFHPQDTLKFNIAFNESVAKEYSTIIEPVVSKILVNQQEITHLTTLRDTLLPKLMSGEIDVNERGLERT
jgi:type I restriction enzyme S subunit